MGGKFWVASVVLLLLVGVALAACGGGGDEAPEEAAPEGQEEPAAPPPITDGADMVVDAVAEGTVDLSRTVAETSPFDIDVVVSKAVSGYQGYQFLLEWDPAVLAYEGQEDLKPAELDLCAAANVRDNTVYGGCARVSENTNYTGPINRLTFRCVADGTSPLHLVTMEEDENFGTSVLGFAGQVVETTLADASVTCQGVGPAPASASPTSP
jgi:hypothetical protein